MKRVILFIIVVLVMLIPSEVDAESQRSFIEKLETGMSFCWKKKKGKYALVRKLKGYDDYYVTDYIYDVSKNGTKEINQAVKNNIEKFPERFSWLLNDQENNDLRSKFLTAKDNL